MTEAKTKAIAPIDEVKGTLQRLEPEFKKALPPQIPAEKFVRVLLTAVNMTPALVAADRNSLFGACMKAAQDGLIPDGREAALVTYEMKDGRVIAQYMPMTAGILKKVRNSGELRTINSQIIHENDRFRYWIDGSGEHLEHEPLLFGDRGKRIGVYAVAITKDGGAYYEVMTEAQVLDVKKVSRAKSGPWSGPFENEMWRKTVIRRLSKRLPMSTDLEEVIRRDDEMYELGKEDTVIETSSRPTRLGAIIDAQTTAPASEQEEAQAENIPSFDPGNFDEEVKS